MRITESFTTFRFSQLQEFSLCHWTKSVSFAVEVRYLLCILFTLKRFCNNNPIKGIPVERFIETQLFMACLPIVWEFRTLDGLV